LGFFSFQDDSLSHFIYTFYTTYLLVIYIYAILSYIQNATTTIAYRFLPLLTATYRYLPLLTATYRCLPLLTATYRYLPLLTATYRYLPLLQLLSTLVDLLPNVIYYIFAICSYIINTIS